MTGDVVRLRGGRVEHLAEWAYVNDRTQARVDAIAREEEALEEREREVTA